MDVLILERVGEIREVGAGLSIWSNAVNAIRQLGVGDALLALGSVVERSILSSRSGETLAVTDLSEVSREAGAPSICIHRSALQDLLLKALPRECVRTGTQCIGFDGSTALVAGGERIDFDILVGADGISSAVRVQLHGATAPRYAGYTCWRGITTDTGELQPGSTLLVVGEGSQFGLFPCGDGRLYWFLTKNAAQGTSGGKAEAVTLCRKWPAPVPQVIEGTPEDAILQNDILDRPSLPWWGRGRVTLLGDAAHAMTPNLGQGACQALEDAVMLGNCLRREPSVEKALRDYESIRIPRTRWIAMNSWRSGRLLQLDQPVLEWLRNRFTASRVSKRLNMQMFRKLLVHPVPDL